MNIEVYEKHVKDRMLNKRNNFEKGQKAKEEKEAIERETKAARILCADYHVKLDKTTYFDASAMIVARQLLPKFKKLKQDLLPESVAKVVQFRIIYLNIMAGLSANSRIKKLMDKFALQTLNIGIFSSDTEEELKKSKEFKALRSRDFTKATKVILKGQKALRPILKTRGNFAIRARKYLMPSGSATGDIRVDDFKAANNLDRGLAIMLKNIRRLSVFHPNVAPKSKPRAKRV